LVILSIVCVKVVGATSSEDFLVYYSFEHDSVWNVHVLRYEQCGLQICCRAFVVHALVAWNSGITLVFRPANFPFLCSTCTWWVTAYVS